MSVLKMNLRLIFTALKKKYHLIWVEKGEWIYPLALYTLKKTGAKLVHYNTDDLYGLTNHFWLHQFIGFANRTDCAVCSQSKYEELIDGGHYFHCMDVEEIS
jgi:hypothetical protein